MKKIFSRFTSALYIKIFGESVASKEMSQFFKNTSFLMLTTIISGVALFVFSVLAARYLGPDELGKYALVISLSNFFLVPMLLGLNVSVVRYQAKEQENHDVILSSLVLLGAFSLISGVILLLFQNGLSLIFHVPKGIIITAIVLSLAYAWYTYGKSVVQSLMRFKRYGVLDIVSACAILVTFLIFSQTSLKGNYISATTSYFIGYSVLFLFVLLFIWRSLKGARFNKAQSKKLIRYGLFTVIGSVAGFALGNIDRFTINAQWGIHEVGIFSAYMMTSMMILTNLLQVFVTVFFPMVCKSDSKPVILHKLNRLMRYFVFILPVVSFCLITIIIKLYGHQYPYYFLTTILFAINSTLYIISRVYSWFLASDDRRGVKIDSIGIVCATVIVTALVIILVPKSAITGAITANIVANLFLTIYYFSQARKVFGIPSNS